MNLSVRIAAVAAATALAGGAVATSAEAATSTANPAAALKCHYNAFHVPQHFFINVFNKPSRRGTHVIGKILRNAKRVPGACKAVHGVNGDHALFIQVRANNGRVGYAGAIALKKVK